MDFHKEGKSAAKSAMKMKDVTVCDVADMARDVAKDLKLRGASRKDFLGGWADAMASASRRRKNPMALGCPSCMRKHKRLRRR